MYFLIHRYLSFSIFYSAGFQSQSFKSVYLWIKVTVLMIEYKNNFILVFFFKNSIPLFKRNPNCKKSSNRFQLTTPVKIFYYCSQR
jgi:hypothetical protein